MGSSIRKKKGFFKSLSDEKRKSLYVALTCAERVQLYQHLSEEVKKALQKALYECLLKEALTRIGEGQIRESAFQALYGKDWAKKEGLLHLFNQLPESIQDDLVNGLPYRNFPKEDFKGSLPSFNLALHDSFEARREWILDALRAPSVKDTFRLISWTEKRAVRWAASETIREGSLQLNFKLCVLTRSNSA